MLFSPPSFPLLLRVWRMRILKYVLAKTFFCTTFLLICKRIACAIMESSLSIHGPLAHYSIIELIVLHPWFRVMFGQEEATFFRALDKGMGLLKRENRRVCYRHSFSLCDVVLDLLCAFGCMLSSLFYWCLFSSFCFGFACCCLLAYSYRFCGWMGCNPVFHRVGRYRQLSYSSFMIRTDFPLILHRWGWVHIATLPLHLYYDYYYYDYYYYYYL